MVAPCSVSAIVTCCALVYVPVAGLAVGAGGGVVSTAAAVPLPAAGMSTFLPPALTRSVALLAPVLVGLKNTGISQPPATGAVHVGSAGSVKCVALAPMIDAVTFAGIGPSLLMVTFCAAEVDPTAWSPNAMLLSTTLKTGRLEPLRLTVWVGTGVSSVTVSVADDDWFAFGAKLTVMVQDVATASVA